MPVNNFAAELLLLFQKAAVNPVSLTVPSQQRAHRFRFRMYSLRKEMRKEHHPLCVVANQVTISIEALDEAKPFDEWVVTAKPVDMDDASLLRSAGIVLDEPDAADIDETTGERPLSALDKFKEGDL